MHLYLHRTCSSRFGTWGMLCTAMVPFALTLEKPWIENERVVSCIPTGTYFCGRVQSPKFDDTFEVCNVPGRTSILFHKGNTLDDTQGCILVGESIGGGVYHPRLESSAKGFTELMDLLQGLTRFELTITARELMAA